MWLWMKEILRVHTHENIMKYFKNMTSQMKKTATVHMNAHKESRGMARNELTAQQAEEELNKAGTWGWGGGSGCALVCLCVWRWCNECRRWAGAALSLAIWCWHTNAELCRDTGLRRGTHQGCSHTTGFKHTVCTEISGEGKHTHRTAEKRLLSYLRSKWKTAICSNE